MARLPRIRFSVIEIPRDAEAGDRGLPALPQEISPDSDPLLARMLIQCARRALSSGPALGEEEPSNARAQRSTGRGHAVEVYGEMPPPLGETPVAPTPTHHQRWPRRDDAPHHPR